MSVIQLECSCNNYPWGKTGSESLAAQYAASTPGGKFELDEKKDYAEMWMGTYPTTPSLVLKTGKDLQEHINGDKEKYIGQPILNKFGADLPYLPKILSIAKALPLQIHPDKELAGKLHKKDPEKYGDANHKPEIAVALGKFEVFVGFKPLSDIQELFEKIDVLKETFAKSAPSTYDDEFVRKLVLDMLSADDATVKKVYKELNSLLPMKFGKHSDYIPGLLPRLAAQYDKADPGNLVALLTMNFLTLEKGDAIYVPADGIHAYLSGDIVECMARSDNVINTGFCPKADRDSAELFTAALKFSPKSGEEAMLKPKESTKGKSGKTKLYAPPMSEFNMLLTTLNATESETIEALQGPGILVVTGGKGQLKAGGETFEAKRGYVFFVSYNTEIGLIAEDGLEVHLAYCEA